MPAEILFSGGRMDSVISAGGSPADTTLAGYFDSSYADAAIGQFSTQTIQAKFYTQSSNVLSETDVVTGESVWLHFEVYNQSATAAISMVRFRNAAAVDWVALRATGAGTTYGIYYNSTPGGAATWVLLGSTFTIPDAARSVIDIRVTLGSPHSVQIYIAGSLVTSGTFSDAALTALRSVIIAGVRTTVVNGYSQIMATRDISTIGAKVKTMRGTGAGANSGWTGAVTDVNEAVGSDTSVNSAGSAGLKQSYAMTDVTVPSGFQVGAVFHWLRAKNDGVAPNNIKSLVRSGGADYSSGNLSEIGLGFAPIGARYDQDPATAANWTDASLDAVEFGFESAT